MCAYILLMIYVSWSSLAVWVYFSDFHRSFKNKTGLRYSISHSVIFKTAQKRRNECNREHSFNIANLYFWLSCPVRISIFKFLIFSFYKQTKCYFILLCWLTYKFKVHWIFMMSIIIFYWIIIAAFLLVNIITKKTLITIH